MNILQKINFILTKENFNRLSIFTLLMLITVIFETLGVALILPALSFIVESDVNTNSEYLNDILISLKETYPKQYLIKISFILIFIIFFLKNLFLFYFIGIKIFFNIFVLDLCKLLN